jgi:beta-lactamase regulating signal transducer with metallopeptidase domain
MLQQFAAIAAGMPWLGQALAKATLALAACWAAHALLARANPRWRRAAWRGGIAGVFALAALTAFGPLDAFSWRLALPPEVAALAQRPAALARSTDRDGATEIAPSNSAPRRASRGGAMVEARNLVAASEPWLFWCWALVAAALAARLLMAHAGLTSLALDSEPCPKPLQGMARSLGAALGLGRPVAVRRSEKVDSPFAFGALRPVVILPDKLLEESRRGDLPAVLAHELAHAKTGDAAWNVAANLLRALLWFHPLAWKMPAAHARACEEVADSAASACVGGAKPYAGALARATLDLLTGARPAPALAGMPMASLPEIRARLDRLERRGPAPELAPWRSGAAGAFALLAGVALGAASLSVEAVSTMPAPSPSAPRPYPKATESPAPGDKGSVDKEWRVEDPSLYVRVAPSGGPTWLDGWSAYSAGKKRPLALSFERGTVLEALQGVAEQSGLVFMLPKAAAPWPVSCEFDGAPAGDAYAAMLFLLEIGWEFVPEQGAIILAPWFNPEHEGFLTCDEAAALLATKPPRPFTALSMERREAHRRYSAWQGAAVSVAWNDAPLATALADLADAAGFRFVVEPEAEAIVANAVVHAEFADSEAGQVLWTLMRQHGLMADFETEDGGRVVISPWRKGAAEGVPTLGD